MWYFICCVAVGVLFCPLYHHHCTSTPLPAFGGGIWGLGDMPCLSLPTYCISLPPLTRMPPLFLSCCLLSVCPSSILSYLSFHCSLIPFCLPLCLYIWKGKVAEEEEWAGKRQKEKGWKALPCIFVTCIFCSCMCITTALHFGGRHDRHFPWLCIKYSGLSFFFLLFACGLLNILQLLIDTAFLH